MEGHQNVQNGNAPHNSAGDQSGSSNEGAARQNRQARLRKVVHARAASRNGYERLARSRSGIKDGTCQATSRPTNTALRKGSETSPKRQRGRRGVPRRRFGLRSFYFSMTLAFATFPETNSFIHELDPRWKLAAALPCIVAAVLIKSLPVAIVGFFSAFLLILLSRLPLAWYSKRMAGVCLFLAVFVVAAPLLIPGEDHFLILGPIKASLTGLNLGLLTLTKALTISTLVLVLLATAPLDATFKAAHSLCVPGLFVQIGMMAYRYLFVFANELLRLRIALRARGYRNRLSRHSYRTISHVAGTLLVRGYERSERVGQAMRCRGFDGQFRSLVDFHTRARDVIAFTIVILVAGGLLAWDWSLG